jgi:hypothetical protein
MVPCGPITKARAKKLKEALNWFAENIWVKMDLKELIRSKQGQIQILL